MPFALSICRTVTCPVVMFQWHECIPGGIREPDGLETGLGGYGRETSLVSITSRSVAFSRPKTTRSACDNSPLTKRALRSRCSQQHRFISFEYDDW